MISIVVSQEILELYQMFQSFRVNSITKREDTSRFQSFVLCSTDSNASEASCRAAPVATGALRSLGAWREKKKKESPRRRGQSPLCGGCVLIYGLWVALTRNSVGGLCVWLRIGSAGRSCEANRSHRGAAEALAWEGSAAAAAAAELWYSL